MSDTERYADKIAKLLRKAESTNSDAEAEALVAKAQALMTKWAIDEAVIHARLKDGAEPEKIVEKRIVYTGVYRQALFDIGAVIARANDCKVLINNWDANKTKLVVIGFESDVERVIMLDSSVQIQAIGAQRRWAKDGIQDWMSGMQRFKARREFLFGYARGLRNRLEAAHKVAVEEAIAAEGNGLELILRSRADRVTDWYDQTYGKSTRTVSRRYAHGGLDAANAGFDAGKRANTGDPAIGKRKELNG